MNDEAKNVSPQYLQNRKQVLNYTNKDMNLKLENDRQVYIALFDIPVDSGIIGFQTQSLALVFGLNTNLYHGSGDYVVGLEKYPKVKKAMQSALISSSQVLPNMKITNNKEFYQSEYVRAYLKTKSGIFFKELNEDTKEDKFLLMLMNNIINEVASLDKLDIKR